MAARAPGKSPRVTPAGKPSSATKKAAPSSGSASTADQPLPIEDAPSNAAAPASTRPAPAPTGLLFTRNFPSDPALARLVTLFEQGNYAQLRRDAPALIQSTTNDAVRAAARQLLDRLKPDPLALYLLAVAAALLVVLAGWYWTHPHETPPPGAPPVLPAPRPAAT